MRTAQARVAPRVTGPAAPIGYGWEMKVAVFHPGTQHSWQTATALQQLGRLAWYATSIFYKPDELPYRLERMLPRALATRVSAEFRRFQHLDLDPSLVRTSGIIEWLERISTRGGARQLAKRLDTWGNARFASQIARELRSPQPFALWGYNGSSLRAFTVAKQYGRRCILDRTNGDFRAYNRMMRQVADQYGEWFLPTELTHDHSQCDREYALADAIVVGSPFAARTIREEAADPAIAAKLRVLNYCYDPRNFASLPAPRASDRSQPVRFLFLGLVIPRKGIQHVLEAIERIPSRDAELTIVGDLKIPRKVFARFADRVTYLPTVPRSEVPRIMSEHHVLLLPSHFEGAGIVLYEALAAGCALIQSRNCAEAVTPQTGMMLNEISTDAVHQAMLAAITDRARLDAWRAAAPLAARAYTFDHYRDNIARLLAELEI